MMKWVGYVLAGVSIGVVVVIVLAGVLYALYADDDRVQ